MADPVGRLEWDSYMVRITILKYFMSAIIVTVIVAE